jgi:hypothetical protein
MATIEWDFETDKVLDTFDIRFLSPFLGER